MDRGVLSNLLDLLDLVDLVAEDRAAVPADRPRPERTPVG
jgi:hypothetical protein